MRKKFLTVLATLAVCGMTCSTAFASIDTSVFENKTEYDVEIDDFDDTGIISFVGGDDQPSGILGGFVKDDDDKGYIYGTVDIKLISGWRDRSSENHFHLLWRRLDFYRQNHH